MDSVGSSNITEYFHLKKAMDTQIGAFNVAQTRSQQYGINMQSTGLRHLDPETDFKVRRIASKVNESLHIAANEPSLGLFRIQEHVCRTLPLLVQRKTGLKINIEHIEGAMYDLNLSMEVVESISKIKNFTCIHEALKTAIEMKRNLNLLEEKNNARLGLDTKNALLANKSLSINEPAEGYICPVCYYALTSQDELISHWQQAHSLDSYNNDVFHEVDLPSEEVTAEGNVFVLNHKRDMTVIEMPDKPCISDCEDVVQSIQEYYGAVTEENEMSVNDASYEVEVAHIVEHNRKEI